MLYLYDCFRHFGEGAPFLRVLLKLHDQSIGGISSK
jgi:hypothetical protein